MKKYIEQLITEMNLGRLMSPEIPVSGGFMHKMYRIETTTGIYAVKALNPIIMARPEAIDNFRRAETFEDILERNNIAIVPAIAHNGNKMIHIGDRFFYVFHWFDGKTTNWSNITPGQCRKAGEILGRMHGIDMSEVEVKCPAAPDVPPIPWDDYCASAKLLYHEAQPAPSGNDRNTELYKCLAENTVLLKSAENKRNLALKSLSSELCISDEDMDPKNVMWDDNGNAVVIDLECLDLGNPASHSLQLALQWSGITTFEFSPEKFKAFLSGYRSQYFVSVDDYRTAFGVAYSWVDWLEYNIRRALRLDGCDASEAEIGFGEVFNTIKRIRYISENESLIISVLQDI